MSLSGFMPRVEKTNPSSEIRSGQRRRSIATASGESGTICGCRIFMRVAGIDQTALSRSNSGQVASRVSPERTAL